MQLHRLHLLYGRKEKRLSELYRCHHCHKWINPDFEPTAHPLEITNVFREDSVGKSWTADAALSQAPQRQNGFFQVPPVLGQGSG